MGITFFYFNLLAESESQTKNFISGQLKFIFYSQQKKRSDQTKGGRLIKTSFVLLSLTFRFTYNTSLNIFLKKGENSSFRLRNNFVIKAVPRTRHKFPHSFGQPQIAFFNELAGCLKNVTQPYLGIIGNQ